MIKKTFSSDRGFTLVEMAIVLTIVGLVIGGIWMATATVQNNMRTAELNKDVLQIVINTRSAFNNFYKTDGLNSATAVAIGIVPANLVNGATLSHPFGSELSIDTATATIGENSGFAVKLKDLPQSACIDLLSKMTKNGSGNGTTGFYRVNDVDPDQLTIAGMSSSDGPCAQSVNNIIMVFDLNEMQSHKTVVASVTPLSDASGKTLSVGGPLDEVDVSATTGTEGSSTGASGAGKGSTGAGFFEPAAWNNGTPGTSSTGKSSNSGQGLFEPTWMQGNGGNPAVSDGSSTGSNNTSSSESPGHGGGFLVPGSDPALSMPSGASSGTATSGASSGTSVSSASSGTTVSSSSSKTFNLNSAGIIATGSVN